MFPSVKTAFFINSCSLSQRRSWNMSPLNGVTVFIFSLSFRKRTNIFERIVFLGLLLLPPSVIVRSYESFCTGCPLLHSTKSKQEPGPSDFFRLILKPIGENNGKHKSNNKSKYMDWIVFPREWWWLLCWPSGTVNSPMNDSWQNNLTVRPI